MIRREKEIPATHLHRRSFDISLAIPWRYREPAWKWQLAVFFVVDCVSELGQHHVDAQQAGERGNNLVSDIPLNAYISYNVSMLKTWSRHSSRTGAGGGGYHYTCATWAIRGWSRNHLLHYFTRNFRHSDVHLCCSRVSLFWILCDAKTIMRTGGVVRIICNFPSSWVNWGLM